ncbi:MAG: hypothetical protein ACOH14_06415 [Rhodoglobus sp.]
MAPTLRSPQGNTITVPTAAVEFYTAKGWMVAGGTPVPEIVVADVEESVDDVPTASWSLKQLTEFAERARIDLGGATKKQDVLAAIVEGNILDIEEDVDGV